MTLDLFSQINMAVSLDYDREVLEARGPKSDEIKSELQEDFVKADIYYQTLNVQSITQSPKYKVIRRG